MVKIGDRVRFLNDIGGGTVTGIVNKNMVSVEDEQGFEVPVLISQLVVVNDDAFAGGPAPDPTPVKTKKTAKEETTPEKKATPPAEPKIVKGKDEASFFLVFVPQNEVNPVDGEIKVYLVNDSNNFLLYNYSHLKNKGYRSVDSGKMNPNSKRYLESFSRFDLNELPDFCFQLIFFLQESNVLAAPIEKVIKMNPVKFYKHSSYEKSRFFANPVMMVSLLAPDLEAELAKLTDKEVAQVVQKKAEVKSSQTRISTPDLVEVDLHIHELLENTAGLSNFEMLEIQLGRFRNEMEDAIKRGVHRIVFIHGVGNGKLKMELRRELSTKYKKYDFQDASFKEYGYGATMVILKR